LGVVGYGGRAHGLIVNEFRAQAPDLRVVGVVDTAPEAVRTRLADCDRDAPFFESVDELVRSARPDALIIGTRCNTHTPYAIQAAAYDLPLFLEKPVAIDMDQALALEQAFEKARCPVVVSFPLRVSPLCELMRTMIAKGEIGDPVHILAANYVPYGTVYWEEPYRDFSITQGLFLQKATHDLDYMMYLMGSRITRVTAMATYGKVFGGDRPAGLRCSACPDSDTCLESPANRRRHLTSGVYGDHNCVFSVDCGSAATGRNEDGSSALVEFESGAHGAYTQVFFTRRDAATRGATVSGYLGTAGFDWYTNQARLVRHHAPFSATEAMASGAGHFGGDTELTHDFLDLIAGKAKTSRTPIETGLTSVYTCLAAKASAEARGVPVDVRRVGAVS
jgi:predicted dehydrogenase